MYLSCRPTVNNIFSVEYWRDLEIWVRELFKVIENGTIREITQELLFVCHCKMALSLNVFEIRRDIGRKKVSHLLPIDIK